MTTQATTHPLLAAAQAILPDVVEVRRRLHRRPEIGLQLHFLGAALGAALSTAAALNVLGDGAQGPGTGREWQ